MKIKIEVDEICVKNFGNAGFYAEIEVSMEELLSKIDYEDVRDYFENRIIFEIWEALCDAGVVVITFEEWKEERRRKYAQEKQEELNRINGR